MFEPRSLCFGLIAAIASVLATALAMAEMSSKESASAFPKMLNEPIMSSDQGGPVVFLISQSWGKLLKGSRLMGVYRLDGDGLRICIQKVIFVDRREQNADPGQCIASAVPAPDAITIRKANGTLIVPQAQPFYLHDIPVEWGRDDARR